MRKTAQSRKRQGSKDPRSFSVLCRIRASSLTGLFFSNKLRQQVPSGARRRVQSRRLRTEGVQTYSERSQAARGKRTKKKKPVSTGFNLLSAVHCAEKRHRAESVKDQKIPFVFRSVPHPRVVVIGFVSRVLCVLPRRGHLSAPFVTKRLEGVRPLPPSGFRREP